MFESTGQAIDDFVGEEICVLDTTGEEICCRSTAENDEAGKPRNEEADAVDVAVSADETACFNSAPMTSIPLLL